MTEPVSSDQPPFRPGGSVPDDPLVTTDINGRILFWNPGAAALFGHAEAEILGHSALELVPPEDRADHLRTLRELFTLGGELPTGSLPLRGFTRDQERIELDLSLFTWNTPHGRRFMGVMRPRQAQATPPAVPEQLSITTKLFEHAVEGMVVMDRDWNVLAANKAFTDICGHDLDTLAGHPAPLFRNQEAGTPSRQDVIIALEQDGAWRGEVRNRRASGEVYKESLAITTVRNSFGRTTHFVAVCHDLSSAIRTEEEFRFHTSHDALTGLPNRFLFTDRLEQILNHAHRSGEHVTLLVLGLDGFKHINESLGHPVGDQVLREVAERIRTLIRREDTVGRLSGDEFAILFRDARHESRSVVAVMQKLMDGLSQPIRIGDQDLTLTASMGLTVFPGDGDNALTLIRNTNLAMTRAKQAGKNTYKFYTSAMGSQATKRLILENSLRKALENEEFVVHYQPKVDVFSGQVMGMEALVRWNQPGMGMVPPGDFITIAEETGLIVPMGRWVLETSCRQTREWLDAGLGPLQVAINLSARQFQVGNLNDTIREVLDKTGLDPRFLELEITESLMMTDIDKSITTLQELTDDMGLKVAVDDFGTGYSSLSYLKQFPIHTIKIDRSFINNLSSGTDDDAIVRAILSLARSLNLQVVAEGVETAEQLAILRELQCEMFQGYLFSKPVDAAAFETLVRRERAKQPAV
ncbi:MAG: EAL domain-containing protein [Magnetococcales bacterium]|nr:EAL domain-containing protein [Magnetococcales bacterium]